MLNEQDNAFLEEKIKGYKDVIDKMWFKSDNYTPTIEELEENIPVTNEESVPFLIWIKTTFEPADADEAKVLSYIDDRLLSYFRAN